MDFNTLRERNSSRASRFIVLCWFFLFSIADAQARTVSVPSPPSGRQATIEAKIRLEGLFADGRSIIGPMIVDPGSGYSEESPPKVLAVSAKGSGAEFTTSVFPKGLPVLGGQVRLLPTSLEGVGSGYSDDLTLVIEPPHMNDFQEVLDDPSVSVIELKRGLYYQNAVISRDLTIQGKGIGKTTISGGMLDSVFKLMPGVEVRLEDLTIIDGLAECGGGIDNDGGTLILERVEIKNCRAYGAAGEGGGIYNRSAARLTIIDSKIHHNAASSNGGGISNSGINTGLLPALGGGGVTAATALLDFFRDLGDTNPPSSETPEEEGYDATVAIAEGLAQDVVELFKDVPNGVKHTFGAFGSDPFDADSGWEENNMPTTVIRNSEISDNEVGKGIAWSKTSLIVGYRTYYEEFHPKDIRFAGFGGGIHNDLGLVVIEGSTIRNNEVDTNLGAMGGGVSSFFGAIKVTDSKLTGNKVHSTKILSTGGAIHSFASWVEVADSKLNDNTSVAGLFLSSGGAIKGSAASYLNIQGCEIDGNSSGGGGGLANDYLSYLRINESTISNNAITGIIGAYGGGIRNENGGILLMSNSTISGNSATGKAKGGGIYNNCDPMIKVIGGKPVPLILLSKVTISNSTISGNIADGKGTLGAPFLALGAGVYNGSAGKDFEIEGVKTPFPAVSNLNLYSCTIYGNKSVNGLIHTGGGLYNSALSSVNYNPKKWRPGISVVEIANNLFADNEPNDLHNLLPTPALINSLGYNLDSDGTGSFASAPSDSSLSSGKRFITQSDVGIVELADNGGPTKTHALLQDSPARNRGNPNSDLLDVSAPFDDQRGLSRVLGGRRDIGAFESQPPVSIPDTFGASDDGYLAFEDSLFQVPAPGVLANDFGQALKAQLTTNPSNGSVSLDPDGSFLYSPDPDFRGPDSFTYRGIDVNGTVGPAVTVSILVQPRLDLISSTPVHGSSIAPDETLLTLQFDEPMSAIGPEARVLLSGSMSGPIPLAFGANNQVLTVIPHRDFQPNETLTLTLQEGLASSAGYLLTETTVMRFQVEATESQQGFVKGDPFSDSAGGKCLFVDLDGDGDLDVVGADSDQNVWMNQGGLNFVSTGQSLETFHGSNTPRNGVAAGDLDADGDVDLVFVTDQEYVKNRVWLNRGDGSFYEDEYASLQISGAASDVRIGDLNNDGFSDLLVTRYLESRVYLNNGNGVYSQEYELGGSLNAESAALGDFNGDGNLDIFIVNSGNGESNQIYLNDGGGRFTDSGQDLAGVGRRSKAVETGDLNGDGFVDAVVTNTGNEPSLQFWLNDGNGQMSEAGRVPHSATGLTLVDVNLDGSLDVVTASSFGNKFWLNDGTANFTESNDFGKAAGREIHAGDADGDGDVDLLLSGTGIWVNTLPPIAEDLTYTVAEDSAPNTLSSVLGGARNLNGYPLTPQIGIETYYDSLRDLWNRFGTEIEYAYEGVWPDGSYVHRVPSEPKNGALTFLSTGEFIYTPDDDFFGTDTFTYSIQGGPLQTNEATVTIEVTPSADPPIGVEDHYPALQFDATTGVFTLSRDSTDGVLANDLDPDLGTLTAVLEDAPAFGTLTLNPNGSFQYTSEDGFTDVDQFTYTLSNASFTTDPILVVLGVYGVQGSGDFYEPLPGELLSVDAASGLLANDDNTNLNLFSDLTQIAKLKTEPANGSVKLNKDGSFIYTPNEGYTGTDSFTYVAQTISSNLGIIQRSEKIRVKIGNTQPVAIKDGPYTTFNGDPLLVDASEGLLANDSDPDFDPILIPRIITGPSNGTIDLRDDGSFTYTPNSGFNGDDSFTYRINDGIIDSVKRTVSLRSVDSLTSVAYSPLIGEVGAPKNTDIKIIFSGTIDVTSVAGRFSVHGSQTGARELAVTASGTTVTLNPSADFLPGETVSVTALSGIKSTSHQEIQEGFVWQFRVGSPRGSRGNFTRTNASSTPHKAESLMVGDLNGDGLPDAFVTNYDKLPTVFINNGNRTFTEREESLGFVSVGAGNTINTILADLDGDGTLDTLARGAVDNGSGGTNTAYHVALNDGSGSFETILELPRKGLVFPVTVTPRKVFPGDFDGDGDLDLFGVGFSGAWLWENDGSANFSLVPNSYTPMRDTPRGGAVGDLDQDGDLDVYLVSSGGGQLMINEGDGVFLPITDQADVGLALAVELADLNGDGFLDALVATSLTNNRVWLNDGAGRFHPTGQMLNDAGAYTNDVALGDLDGDGSLDLWQAAIQKDVAWYRQSSGFFESVDLNLENTNSKNVAFADFDLDGDLDVFIAKTVLNGGSFLHEVLFNEATPIGGEDFFPSNGTDSISSNSPGILGNDSMGDGANLIAVLESEPQFGSIALNSNGSFVYTPGPGFSGSDVFTYRAKDSLGQSEITRVKIGNSRPISAPDLDLSVAANQTSRFKAPGVLGNDSDPDGDSLEAIRRSSTTLGVVELFADGSFNYTPPAGYTGPDVFHYVASDGVEDSIKRKVTLNVQTALTIEATTPSPNAVAIESSSVLKIEFNFPLVGNSITDNVRLWGSLHGKYSFTQVLEGSTLRIIPDLDFIAGEEITVVLSDGIEGVGGAKLFNPVLFNYVVAAPSGEGVFTNSGQSLGNTSTRTHLDAQAGDLNGDGSVDFLVSHNQLSENGVVTPGFGRVWLNNGKGKYSFQSQKIGETLGEISLGDVDADGDLDFVSGDRKLWLNNGEAVFSDSGQTFESDGRFVDWVKLLDLDGDGDLDCFQVSSEELTVFLNDGTGFFTENPASVASLLPPNGIRSERISCGDVNGDGFVDVVFAETSPGAHIVLINDGTGIFSAELPQFGIGGKAMDMADLDGDGDLDIFSPRANSLSFVWLNNGNGVFTDSGQPYPVDLEPEGISYTLDIYDIELADIDGDGDMDAVVSQRGYRGADRYSLSTIYINDGAGVFTDSSISLGDFDSNDGDAPAEVLVSDVNNDSALDLLIFANFLPDQVWMNQSLLAPLEGLGEITIDDKDVAMPFSNVRIQGGNTSEVSVKIIVQRPARGDFTSESIEASGFTGPAGGPYERAASSAASAQTALMNLVFRPAENREAAGVSEISTLVVKVNDGETEQSDSATVKSISVNDAPIAQNDEGVGFTTTEGQLFLTANVFANDLDVDPGEIFTISSLDTAGTQGDVVDNENGTFTYDPGTLFDTLAVGQSTTDTFAYTLQDASGAVSSAIVTITIEGKNSQPVAMSDALTLSESSNPIVIGQLLLLNDEDIDNGDKTGFSVGALDTTGTTGTAALLPDGTVSYLPGENLSLGETLNDRFQYRVVDANGGESDFIEVTVTIEGQADSPVAGADALDFEENAPDRDITDLVLNNDTDPDPGQGASLMISEIDTLGTIGTVYLGSGVLVYDPDDGFDGLAEGETARDSFSYTVIDADGLTASATVTINISGKNDAPIALSDHPIVEIGSPAADVTALLLSNDIDPDEDDQSSLKIIAIDKGGTVGTVTFADGSVSYQPAPEIELTKDEIFTDTFRYTIEDVFGATGEGVATVYVIGLNSPPVAEAASFSAYSGKPLSKILTATDVDDDAIKFEVDSGPTNGTLDLSSDGSFTYRSNDGFSGEDTFTYTASDATTSSIVTTVRILVSADAPFLALDYTENGAELSIQAIPGAGYLIESSNDLETWSPVAGPLEPDPDNVVRYTHKPESPEAVMFYRVKVVL